MTGFVASARPDAGQFTIITLTGPLAAVAAGGLASELSDLAAAAFAAPPWKETPAHARQLTTRMLADARHPAFVLAFAFAFTGHGPALAGFGYGVPRWPGPAIAGTGQASATEPFELCELAVRPGARGQGAGRALHDAIVAASGPQLRWLVTHPAAHPAVSLYRARGWHTRRLFPSRADGSPRLLMARAT